MYVPVRECRTPRTPRMPNTSSLILIECRTPHECRTPQMPNTSGFTLHLCRTTPIPRRAPPPLIWVSRTLAGRPGPACNAGHGHALQATTRISRSDLPRPEPRELPAVGIHRLSHKDRVPSVPVRNLRAQQLNMGSAAYVSKHIGLAQRQPTPEVAEWLDRLSKVKGEA